jgi:hypothetical protein
VGNVGMAELAWMRMSRIDPCDEYKAENSFPGNGIVIIVNRYVLKGEI